MASKQRKSYINDKVGAKGLNLFDTSRSIGEYQCRRFTNAIPSFGGAKSMYGFRVFNDMTATRTGGIPLLHGFKVTKYTPAYLTGGTSATAVVGTWTAVSDGEFSITINGTAHNVTGIDFSSGVTTMADVASKIQTALRTATSGTETVVWSTDKFIITSDDTTFTSAITVTSAVGGGAGTDISGAGGTAFMDAETGRGTATPALANDFFKQLIFAQDDDYFYLEPDATTSTTPTTIGDYGTTADNPHAITSGGYTIFGTASQTNTPYKWDGVTLSAISNVATDYSDLGFYEFFQGQDFAAVFGAGDKNNPSRLYNCNTNSPNDWENGIASYIDIAKDDGFAITGLKAQGDQLIVYKEKNRYYVSTFYESNTGTYGVRVLPYVDNSGGSLSHDSIQVVPNGDILSLGSREIGLQGIGKTQSADGSLIPKDYSRDIKPIFEQLNYNYIYKAKAAFHDKKIWLSVPFGRYATENNYLLILDTDTEGWAVIPDINIGDFEVFEDENGDDVLYASDSQQAIIYKWDKNYFLYNEDKIQTKIGTGKLNLGSIIDYEDLEVIALEGSMQEGDELKLTISTDGVETSYIIDKTFLKRGRGSSGYIANDLIADEYIAGGVEEDNEESRWLAILLISSEQRKAREVELHLENLNEGANFSWNYLSINEFGFEEARLQPENHVIRTEATTIT